jgi:hypothetical protein
MLSACSSNEATVTADPIPLTHYSGYEDWVSTSSLKTEEGIVISCSDKYVLGNAFEGFHFQLSDEESNSPRHNEDDYDWKLELTSNANIVKVDFYNYKDELIGSEECKNNTAIIDRYYNGEYCDSFTLYIEEGNNLYTAHFYRSGT